MLWKTILIGLVAVILIWVVYAYHVWNYPQERQIDDATELLATYGYRPAVNLDFALIENKFTRPLGQYLLGTLMVVQRSAGGNTAYFLGEVTNVGSRLYFPLLYLLKIVELQPLHDSSIGFYCLHSRMWPCTLLILL